ncbi:hypothetical protein JCM10213_000244 [Rhodosporidiobolus nylandii]
MQTELSAASDFLASYLPTPDDKRFSQQLSTTLAQRYAGHWHPADPERGSAFRALVRTPAALDSSIVSAADEVGLSTADVEEALAGRETSKVALGDRWTLWVDPGCVSLRVDRGEGGARDGQFIEIYGKLPEALAGHAVPLASVLEASSNIPPPTVDAAPLSPVKRSKAIQIVAPPGGRSALQAMTNAALMPDSPAVNRLIKPTALLASPLIIPPTPVRPLPASEADVFSPTPAAAASSLLLPPRSPSPGTKYGSLSPTSYRPSSPLGMPLFTRRSSSRNSSVSSNGGDSGSGSDGETSGCDSLFSASGDSVASLTSAGSAAPLWKGSDVRDADGFRVPALPSRPMSTGPFSGHGAQHSRGSSVSSLAPPPSPSRATMSPSSYSAGGRSLPGSPTKPRRRGVRGGQGHRSESSHSHSSSISSIASLTSTATPSTPSQTLATGAEIERSVTPSAGRSRTETSSSAQTATEYSNGLVKVLGGGVLLGCGGGGAASGQHGKSSRSTTPSGEPSNGEGRRRRRERGRGGRGGQGQSAPGASPMGSFSGVGASPCQPSPFQGMPPSPVWMGHGASPFQYPPQGRLPQTPMQA